MKCEVTQFACPVYHTGSSLGAEYPNYLDGTLEKLQVIVRLEHSKLILQSWQIPTGY